MLLNGCVVYSVFLQKEKYALFMSGTKKTYILSYVLTQESTYIRICEIQ